MKKVILLTALLLTNLLFAKANASLSIANCPTMAKSSRMLVCKWAMVKKNGMVTPAIGSSSSSSSFSNWQRFVVASEISIGHSKVKQYACLLPRVSNSVTVQDRMANKSNFKYLSMNDENCAYLSQAEVPWGGVVHMPFWTETKDNYEGDWSSGKVERCDIKFPNSALVKFDFSNGLFSVQSRFGTLYQAQYLQKLIRGENLDAAIVLKKDDPKNVYRYDVTIALSCHNQPGGGWGDWWAADEHTLEIWDHFADKWGAKSEHQSYY